jgi:hypothetical protein
MVPFGHTIILFWNFQSTTTLSHRAYYNGNWSSVRTFGSTMSAFCPVVSWMSGIETLNLFYTSSSPYELFVTNSTDGGISWSTTRRIATTTNSIKYITGVDEGDGIDLGFSFSDANDIGYGYFLDTGTFKMDIVGSFLTNTLDTDSKEIMIGNNLEDVVIAHENSQGTVDLIISRDRKDFSERIEMGQGLAHSLSIEEDLSVFCFMNGTDLEVVPINPSIQGKVYSLPLSPIGITSWNDFGITASGLVPGAELDLRIWDTEGMQLYPVSGYLNISTLSEMTIEGRDYRYAGDLSGSWCSGVDIVESIILELRLKRNGDHDPLVFDLCVNYTVGYPFLEDMSEEDHIWGVLDCTITPVGLELKNGADIGWAIFGPVEFEGERPDHLSVRGTLLGNGNRIRAELLDTEMEPIKGFTIDDSSVIDTTESEEFIRWGVKNLIDIPPTFSEVFIKIVINRGHDSDPIMNWFKLGGSEPPTVIGGGINISWINRGGAARIKIQSNDREDPVQNLYLQIECKEPVSGAWSSDLLSDPLFDGSAWIADLQTDMSTNRGTYEFRARSEDRTGLLSDWTMLAPVLEVRNNIPTSPIAAVDPPLPLVTDDIEIKMLLPGEDLEIEGSELEYNVNIYSPEGLEEQFRNLTTPEMIIQELDMNKDEVWTIEIRTWDGENESQPSVLQFEVQNSKPFTTNRLPSSITLIEDEEWLEEGFTSWFSDDDAEDILTYTIEPSSEISTVRNSDGIRIQPMEDFNGEAYFNIIASDGESTEEANVTVVVLEVNDEPLWNNGIRATVEQGQWLYVDIGAEDLQDPEIVDVELSISEMIPGIVPGKNLFVYPNGSFELKADNGMIGEYNISFIVKDAEHVLNGYLRITVENVNDAPSIEEAGPAKGSSIFLAGEEIVFEAHANDVDLMWGDQLIYEWDSHISGIIGQGESMQAQLPEGIHRITLTVTDIEGDSDSTIFMITVVGEEMDEGNVMRTWLLFTIFGVSSFLISLIFALIIFLVVRKSRKEERKDALEDGEGGVETKKDGTIGEGLGKAPGLEGLKEGGITTGKPQLPPKQEENDQASATSETPVDKGEQARSPPPAAEPQVPPPVNTTAVPSSPPTQGDAALDQNDPGKEVS